MAKNEDSYFADNLRKKIVGLFTYLSTNLLNVRDTHSSHYWSILVQ